MGIKYTVDENFFDRWSPTMAYVLGFWYADGSLENAAYIRGKYIRVTSTDKPIIENIKRWLKAEHPIVKVPPLLSHRKERYLLRIGSHKLYQALSDRGLYPNKSLTILFPVIPKRYLSHFVRGYLDGDGCVYVEMGLGKQQQIIMRRLSTYFTSGSKQFLGTLDGVLRQALNLKGSRVYLSRRSFQLRYSTSDSIVLFKFLYKAVTPELYFPRKFGTFQKYFSLRPQRADREVIDILKGAVAK